MQPSGAVWLVQAVGERPLVCVAGRAQISWSVTGGEDALTRIVRHPLELAVINLPSIAKAHLFLKVCAVYCGRKSMDCVTLLKDIPSDDGISSRRSQDNCGRVCEFGKRLVDMSISSRLNIANGRVIGDTSGRYTCHQYNGSSLVDYVLADDAMISQMRYLHVNDLHGHLTDHCMVSFGIAVKVSIQINIPKANKTKMQGRV